MDYRFKLGDIVYHKDKEATVVQVHDSWYVIRFTEDYKRIGTDILVSESEYIKNRRLKNIKDILTNLGI